MRRAIRKAAWLAAAVLAAGGAAWALGMETFGNQPFSEVNYRDWPGIMPVANHPSRVYHTWINGNEDFYYQSDLAALNDTLRKFAEARGKDWEVVLRPGPGVAHSFDGSRTIPYGWHLNLTGGIARHVTTLDQGDQVWSKVPVLTIWVGGEIELAKVQFPAGLKVIGIGAVKQRTRAGLKSTDRTVRGWANGVLASLDPYDAASRDAITAMLKDPDNWVRLNAAGALAVFGHQALPALPQLRAALETDDPQLKTRLQESIQAIEKAPDSAAAERAHRQTMDAIQQLLEERAR